MKFYLFNSIDFIIMLILTITIILIICITCNAYKNVFCKIYNCLNPTFTIISNDNDNTVKFLSKLKKHKINHVYMDIELFKLDELESICEHHLINKCKIYNQPLIFDDSYKYIPSIKYGY